MLCVTHDLAAARTFARVLVIEDGRVVEDGAPAALATDPGSRLRALLDAELRLAERTAPTLAQAPQPPLPDVRPRRPPAFPGRHVLGLAVASLSAGAAATGALVLGAGRLGDGLARSGDGVAGLAGVLTALGAAGVLSGVAAVAAGRGAVALGRRLRERALERILHGEPDDRTGDGPGRRFGRVLDLEQLETVALGAGTLVIFGTVEVLAATAVLAALGRGASACVLLATLVVVGLAARGIAGRALVAADARTDVTRSLVERLIGVRTVTMQEDPDVEAARREASLT